VLRVSVFSDSAWVAKSQPAVMDTQPDQENAAHHSLYSPAI